MKRLIINFLGEEKPLVVVYSNMDGTFRVESEHEETKQYFSELIGNISQKHPTLSLIGGPSNPDDDEIIKSGGCVLVERKISNSDPEYLTALGDYLTQQRCAYKGARIGGYTEYFT